MSNKPSEKKKFKRIRLISSSSVEEESCVHIDPGYKSSETSPHEKEIICNNLDNVDVAGDSKEVVVASSKHNDYCNDKIENARSDVLFTSNSSNSSKTNPIVREFGRGLKMFTNDLTLIIDVQIEQMHYYLRSMLKDKKRQEEDVADFEKLQRKLELLGKPAKGLEITQIKKAFKKKAKVLGAKFIRRLKQAMSQLNDQKSYITVIFVKTLKLFSSDNKIPSPKFIIKCRLAIQGMLELNCCKEDLFKFFFITMEDKDFISIIQSAWHINSLVSDIAKYEIDLSDGLIDLISLSTKGA